MHQSLRTQTFGPSQEGRLTAAVRPAIESTGGSCTLVLEPAVPLPYTRLVRRGTWDVGDRTPCELYSNSTVALDVDTGEIKWYYQHLPCDDWDMDFVQERTLIDTVVNPDPDEVMWINPKLAGTAEERRVVVTLGEPGGLFVNDRETGEFLWATPLPYTSTERFVISDIDVDTGQVFINMDLVAKELGQQFIICGHNVKGWWSWSYSPLTKLLYIPIKRTCLNQTANAQSLSGTSPRFTIPEPGFEEDGDLTEVRAIEISTGRGEVAAYAARPERRDDARDGRQRRLLRRPQPPFLCLRCRERRGAVENDTRQPDHRVPGHVLGWRAPVSHRSGRRRPRSIQTVELRA